MSSTSELWTNAPFQEPGRCWLWAGRFYWKLHTSSVVVVDEKGKGNLRISHQDREQCRLFSALTFPHKRLHHWEELGWCRSGNVSAILSHREHCRLTTLSRKTSLHSLREKNGEGRRKKKKKGKRFLLIAYYVQATCQVLWVGHPGIKRPVGTLPGCPPVWQPWGSSSLHLLIYSSVDHRRDAENLLCKEMMNQRKNSSTYLHSTWNSRVEEENNSIWISINFQCFKRKSQGSSIVEGSAYFNSWEFHLCITWAIQQIVVFVFGEFHMPEEELRRAGLGRLGWMLGLGRVGSGSCPPQFFSNVNIMEAKKRPLKFFWK